MNQNDKRTIEITGKGVLRLRPDTTRITLTLTGLEKEYGDTLTRSSADTDTLKETLRPFGFARQDLKTLDFRVDPQHESYKENGAYKERLIGYQFRHVLKVEFSSDRERLGKILYALTRCPVHPEFSLSYTVKDEEAAKNELLAKAVEDAKAKAAVLTAAAGVTLGELLHIDYSRVEVDLEVRPMGRMMAMNACIDFESSCDLDIEPDDIEAEDAVTVLWEIV